MQKLLFGLLTVLALLGLPTWSQAQTDIVNTTITEAVTSTATSRTFTVASATGISAGVYLLIDNDVCRVAGSYSTGTAIPVLCTNRPTTHGDNARVWVFPNAATVTRAPQGSCTRGEGDATYTLTLITSNGTMAGCHNSDVTSLRRWLVTDISGVNGIPSDNPSELP